MRQHKVDPVAKMTGILRQNYETALRAVQELSVTESEQQMLNTRTAVRCCVRQRLSRSEFLPGHLFADPAWDMLLALYEAELDQVRLATSSLCDSSEVPATTALRWMTTLLSEGMIERHSDPLDARRVFVRLSEKGLHGMEAYFQSQFPTGSR